jgi:hypothetical protein
LSQVLPPRMLATEEALKAMRFAVFVSRIDAEQLAGTKAFYLLYWFTCFTGTSKASLLAPSCRGSTPSSLPARRIFAQFTCFTGTKVQILTQLQSSTGWYEVYML